MKKITWAEFIAILNNEFSVAVVASCEIDFCINAEETEIEIEEFISLIKKENNEHVNVEGNIFYLYDGDDTDFFKLEIFKKTPWVIQ